MNKLNSKPSPATPNIVCQMTAMLSANAACTSFRNGFSNWRMTGIAAYAI